MCGQPMLRTQQSTQNGKKSSTYQDQGRSGNTSPRQQSTRGPSPLLLATSPLSSRGCSPHAVPRVQIPVRGWSSEGGTREARALHLLPEDAGGSEMLGADACV